MPYYLNTETSTIYSPSKASAVRSSRVGNNTLMRRLNAYLAFQVLGDKALEENDIGQNLLNFYNLIRDKKTLTPKMNKHIKNIVPALSKIESDLQKTPNRVLSHKLYSGLKLETESEYRDGIIYNCKTPRVSPAEFSHSQTLKRYLDYMNGTPVRIQGAINGSRVSPARRVQTGSFYSSSQVFATERHQRPQSKFVAMVNYLLDTTPGNLDRPRGQGRKYKKGRRGDLCTRPCVGLVKQGRVPGEFLVDNSSQRRLSLESNHPSDSTSRASHYYPASFN